MIDLIEFLTNISTLLSITIVPLFIWGIKHSKETRAKDATELREYCNRAITEHYYSLEIQFLKTHNEQKIEELEAHHQEKLFEIKVEEIIVRLNNIERYLAKESKFVPRKAVKEET